MSILLMFVGLMYVFFCKGSVHILCPLLNWLVCFVLVNLFEFFVNSGYQPFVIWVNCKHFLPFCWLPIHSNNCFFCLAEAAEFNQIPFVYFGFCCQGFWCFGHEVLAYSYVLNGFAQIFSRVFMVPGLTFKSLIHLELILV